MLTFIVLSSFGLYATLRAFGFDFLQGQFSTGAYENFHYFVYPYLSPFSSPNLKEWFPSVFSWWQFSPAILILPFPLVFRATCYYYRKAYYRSYFMDPPACAVGEPRGGSYKGETAFPFILQNLHRYAFYAAAIFIGILGYDAVVAYIFKNPTTGANEFGMGVGSLVLTINVLFLGLYTFSCHSFRHLIGGNVDCFSCSKFGHTKNEVWSQQSKLNENHMQFAWISLFTVWGSDLYIYLLSKGIIHDVRLF